MKTLKKVLFPVLVCLILINCSSDSESNPEVENEVEEPVIIEPSSTQIGIDVNGLDDIDYNGAIALSPDVEEEINANGIFEDHK